MASLSEAKVCCVIGDPIEHSLSPIMHNAAFRKLGLNFVFVAFRVAKENLEDAIKGIRALSIKGVSVTIPHKVAIMSYLDEVDPLAQAIGAVNLVNNVEGRLIGYNSDGLGALKALERNGVSIKGMKVVMLGAGGAARAIAYTLASRCKELRILNRTPSSAQGLVNALSKRFKCGLYYDGLTKDALAKALKDADLLINTTPLGMYPEVDQSPVDKELLRSDVVVFDIVYNPIETRLLKDAKEKGAKTISGVDMLVHQGAIAFKEWTSYDAPVDVMKDAVLARLEARR